MASTGLAGTCSILRSLRWFEITTASTPTAATTSSAAASGCPKRRRKELRRRFPNGTPEDNAKITLDILSGEERGTKRSIVLLNAGAGLYIADKASTMAEGVRLAGELIDSGAALKKVEQFREASNK